MNLFVFILVVFMNRSLLLLLFFHYNSVLYSGSTLKISSSGHHILSSDIFMPCSNRPDLGVSYEQFWLGTPCPKLCIHNLKVSVLYIISSNNLIHRVPKNCQYLFPICHLYIAVMFHQLSITFPNYF